MASTHAKAPYSAHDVARYFIYLASLAVVGDKGEREGITNLKLQKILYFAQAYYLAKLGHPLFKDPIEAWRYGPVVPNVYRAYRKHKNDAIFSEEDVVTLSEDDKSELKKIWDSFGAYSASRLVDIAHAHEPWKTAYQSKSKLISNDVLAEYYRPLLNS